MAHSQQRLNQFETDIKTYQSNVVRDANFKKNEELMQSLAKELDARLHQCLKQGHEKSISKHISAGKLLPRERIEMLLDEDSPFLELCPLAGFGQKDIEVGASTVAGIGLVSGVLCLVTASVSTIKGGSVNRMTLAKNFRCGEIGLENRLPSINLSESGGADLTKQAEVFHLGGGTFRGMARRSKMRIPTVTVVFGSSTAGGAYVPGMSDYNIFVKGNAKVFLGGPPLVKMATNEIVDDETLGGAEMHSKVSGLSDYLAKDEYHAIKMAREIVFNFNSKQATPYPDQHLSRSFQDPLYDIEDLYGLVPADYKQPYEVREVIARLVDGSRFSEFKKLYGGSLVCCWAKIHGFSVGILANNTMENSGVLFTESANKGTQFIQLCNMSNTPLIFLQNITGFMVGKRAEQQGIIKAGARLINAISNSEVPAITILIGASFGAGNYGMSGREYKPRFLFTWPNSRCAVMGAEQLSGVLDIIKKAEIERTGIQMTPEMEKMAGERTKRMLKQADDEASPYYTTSRVIDDGIIQIRDTRNVLAFCLAVIHNTEIKGGNSYGVSRM